MKLYIYWSTGHHTGHFAAKTTFSKQHTSRIQHKLSQPLYLLTVSIPFVFKVTPTNSARFQQYLVHCIAGVAFSVINVVTNVAHLCGLRVSPCWFHGGEVFHEGGNIWDTCGLGGPAALRPLTGASTIALLRQSSQCPTSTLWWQTNQTSTICIISMQDSVIT